MASRLRSVSVLLALVSCVSIALAQEQNVNENYVDIPGTKVSLRVPHGFSLAAGFPGLVRQEVGAFVAVNQISAPLTSVKTQLSEDALASDGAKLLRTEDVSVSGMEAILAQFSQTSEGEAVQKWILLFGGDSFTVMVAASAPPALESELGDELRQTLLTARYFPDRRVDPYYGLGFTMRESTLLEVRAHFPGGVLMTRKGAPQELTPDDPVLVVYPADSPEVAPLEILAMQQLTDTEQFTGFANFDEQAVTINGTAGYEIIADAKVAELNIPVRIYLVALRAGAREMVLEGVVAAAGWEQYLPEFRALAESFQLNGDGGH